MHYLNSKQKNAKVILHYVLRGYGTEYKSYIEPFCGGCRTLQHVPLLKPDCSIVGYDKNEFLIRGLSWLSELHKYVNNTYLQNAIDEILKVDAERFKELKDVARLDTQTRIAIGGDDKRLGVIGHVFSYRGDFFSGYVRDGNIVSKALNSMLATAKDLRGKCLCAADFRHVYVDNGNPSIIYCDPPHVGERYSGKSFKAHWLEFTDKDREDLYAQMRQWRADGHAVFLTDYAAPEDFIPIWSENTGSVISGETLQKNETLYTLW